MEWDSSLYINFVDYEKAFDSLDRDTLWKLLQHYGIPEKFISLIRSSYEDMACRVIHAGQLTDSFMVKTRAAWRERFEANWRGQPGGKGRWTW